MSPRAPRLIIQNGGDESQGLAALQRVLDLIAAKRSGEIIKTDEISHCTLQALRGYQAFKSGVPEAVEAVSRYFPKLYVLLARIHQEIADEIVKSQPPPESKPSTVPRGA